MKRTHLKSKVGLKRKTPLRAKKSSRLRIRRDGLDALFSEYIRKRAKSRCERCGKVYDWRELQACHFHGRAAQSVRFDPDNACACCFGDHQFLDSHALEKVEFFRQMLGEERFDMLNSRARISYPKPDRKAIELYLREKLKELDGE